MSFRGGDGTPGRDRCAPSTPRRSCAATPGPGSSPSTRPRPARRSPTSESAIATAAHALPSLEVAERWATDVSSGLSGVEAACRLTRFGPNAVGERPRRGPWGRLLDQLRNGMVALLALAAAVSLAIGEPLDAVVIGAIVAANTALGFWQEGKTARAADAVRALLSPVASVLRDGAVQRVAAGDVVPGDVVVLRAGDRIPADGRFASADGLEVDESALSGESLPVAKAAEPPVAVDAQLADRTSMGYTGTTVTRGRGTLLVTATGPVSEVARIVRGAEEAGTQRTPLQVRLDRLASTLIRVALAIAIGLTAITWAQGESLGQSVLVGVSLAVAAVPEGLPAVVTVALTAGVRKLAERGAVVRRLPAVETLGSTTTICTDKTGTLTENRMTVAEVLAVGRSTEADVLEAALICSELAADPGEQAIAEAARARGIERDEALASSRVVAVRGFDAARKRMSVVVESPEGLRVYVKGAPEVVASRLAHAPPGAGVAVGRMGRTRPARAVRGGPGACRRRGRRARPRADRPHRPRRPTAGVGRGERRDGRRRRRPHRDGHRRSPGHGSGDRERMRDRPACHDRGRARGPRRGRPGGRAPEVDVFARVVPEHKQRIVEALRERGEIVAMTGDGINDIPGLAGADIGVAMGRGGSDAAVQTADMVLTDDDYGTIVAAIRAGRAIYDDILRFTQFLLAANLGEVLVFALAILLGYPAPLAVLQILMVNLLTDGLPAVALGFDPPERDVMRRPPRPPGESLLRPLRADIALGGAATGAAAFAAFLIGDAASPDDARTMAFTTLVFAQLAYVFAVRGSDWAVRAGGNRLLVGAVLLSAAIAAVVLAVRPIAERFSVVPLSAGRLGAALALALVPFACAEAVKAWRRRVRPTSAS